MAQVNSNYNTRIDDITESEWTNLLENFDDAAIYQTWPYGKVRWGEKNLSHIVLEKNNSVVAVGQLVIKKLPIIGSGIAYMPWGPVWRKKYDEKDLSCFREMSKALNEEYVSRRRLLLRITPNAIEGDDDDLKSVLEEEGYQLISKPYKTPLIDLSMSMEELRKTCSRTWRRALKAAEQYDLQVIQGTSDDLYEALITLFDEMVTRKGFDPGINIHEFRQIQLHLSNSLKMKIMVCKFKDKPVAALMASLIGKKGIGLIGATGTPGLNMGAFHLLNWRMMEWMKDCGAYCYDFGGYDPKKNPGTAKFKEGLPGQIVYHIGQFEACKSFLSAFTVKYVEKHRTKSAQKQV